GGKQVNYLYNGTGELISMTDWTGTTTFQYDLLNQLTQITDPNSRIVKYSYDPAHNQTQIKYLDNTTADYTYDAENRIVQTSDPDNGIFIFGYDPNGNLIAKSYPNGESETYAYDKLNRVTHYLEISANQNQNRLTTYSWDKEGNRTGEIRRNVGQTNQFYGNSGSGGSQSSGGDGSSDSEEMELAEYTNYLYEIMSQELADTIIGMQEFQEGSSGAQSIEVGYFVLSSAEILTAATVIEVALDNLLNNDPDTAFDILSTIATGMEINADDPVTGTFAYQFDALYRVTEALEPNKVKTNFVYDSLGNLVHEERAVGSGNGNTGNGSKEVYTYQYNKLNQLTLKKEQVGNSNNSKDIVSSYDLRGNLISEVGHQSLNVNSSYVYDGTNRMVEGTNWKNEKSHYTYNGLGYRVQQKEIVPSGPLTRQFVPDYTSSTGRDLVIYKLNETVQRHIYAGTLRLEQITEHYPGNNGQGNMERKLYVHVVVMGTSIRYSKDNGNQFAAIDYDLFGAAISPSKLNNNDKGLDILADYTGYTFDYILDKYFAQYRFYDANNRHFMAKDPIKSGLNWYAYVGNNPVTWVDPWGLRTYVMNGINNTSSGVPAEFNMFVEALTERGVDDVIVIGLFTNTNRLSGGFQVIREWGTSGPDPNTDYQVIYYANIPQDGLFDSTGNPIESSVVTSLSAEPVWNSEKMVTFILKDLEKNPLKPGEEINFVAFSGGGTATDRAITKLRRNQLFIGELDKYGASINTIIYFGVPAFLFNNYREYDYWAIYGVRDPFRILGYPILRRLSFGLDPFKTHWNIVNSGHDYFDAFYLEATADVVSSILLKKTVDELPLEYNLPLFPGAPGAQLPD
ncbi:MAG: hypothetical protein FWE76_04685, partial [Symbiobacteriaceae bacterium]|nr:hypothetical protein [Symbiobacteriaceae bacterium]